MECANNVYNSSFTAICKSDDIKISKHLSCYLPIRLMMESLKLLKYNLNSSCGPCFETHIKIIVSHETKSVYFSKNYEF